MPTVPACLIGVGAMGRPFLELLRAAGQRVQAFDVDETCRRSAAERGAEVAESAAAAARGAAFIHVLVASDEQAQQAVAGQNGVLDGAEPGALILLHSTVLPQTTKHLAELAAQKRVDLIDAPVTAVPSVLAAGDSQFLVGGSADLVDKARAQLLVVGRSVLHFGPLGSGNVVKIAKALLNANDRVSLNETLEIVSAGGVDVRSFLNFERETRPQSSIAHWESLFTIVDNHARIRPATNLFRKDIFLAAKLAQSYGVDAPVTRGSAQTAVRWIDLWDKAGKKTA